MELLTRTQILDKDDREYRYVAVPEWGGHVKVRGLSALERDEFEDSLMVEVGRGRKKTREANIRGARAKLVSLTLVDEEDNLVFTEGDIQALNRKSAAAMDRLWEVASELSGLSDKDVDELVGNSEPTLDAGSF